MSARLTGELVGLGGGRVGIRDDAGRTVDVLWPSGYVANSASPPELVDGKGKTIAKVGDRLQIDGGENSTGAWVVCEGKITPLP